MSQAKRPRRFCFHCDRELSYSAWKCHMDLYDGVKGGATSSVCSEPQLTAQREESIEFDDAGSHFGSPPDSRSTNHDAGQDSFVDLEESSNIQGNDYRYRCIKC